MRDFDKRTLALTVSKDKNVNSRQISSPQVIADFFAEQVKAADLPGAASACTLRHSGITDLIRARLPSVTVAHLSCTSIALIEKHYEHLMRDDSEEALASNAV